MDRSKLLVGAVPRVCGNRGGERMKRVWDIPPNNKWILRNILVEDVTGRAESSVASSITGAGRCRPANVTLRDVKITCKGAGDLYVPKDVPESKSAYPSSIIFAKGLPAWGLYVRHADNVRLENTDFVLVGEDKREKMELPTPSFSPAVQPAPNPMTVPGGFH